jgi:hypothetical protein
MIRITRGTLPLRRALLVGIAALSMVAIAATAQAKVAEVTGGTATFSPSDGLTHALSSHGVSTAAIAPATLSGGTLSMPVVGGHVERKHLYGDLKLGGGVKFSKGTKSLALTRMVAVNSPRGAFLSARAAGKRHVIARFTHITKSISGHTATLNAKAVLSAEAAALINHKAGHHVVSRGAPLGTASATVTVG